jgi:phosphomannomutase
MATQIAPSSATNAATSWTATPFMTLWALTRHQQNTLNPPLVVATEMSNLGMQKRLEAEGIQLHRTKVGDRYVAEAMRATGALIGGEQSGHIIFSERTTTGDGLITMLETLALWLHHQKPFSEIAHPFEPYPQKLVSVSLCAISTAGSRTPRSRRLSRRQNDCWVRAGDSTSAPQARRISSA